MEKVCAGKLVWVGCVKYCLSVLAFTFHFFSFLLYFNYTTLHILLNLSLIIYIFLLFL